jgi:hypothetical protein
MSVERQVRTDSTVNLTERGPEDPIARAPAGVRSLLDPDMRAVIRPSCGGLHFANGKIAKRAMNSSRRGENIRPSVTSHKGAKVLAKLPPCLVGIEACPPAHHRPQGAGTGAVGGAADRRWQSLKCRWKPPRSSLHCHSRLLDTHVRLREIDRNLTVLLPGNNVALRLMTIPCIGAVGATALAASVSDPHQFRSGRQFAAWLGLTPLQKSSPQPRL